MLIKKSKGITPSERFLANLAEKTFLNLWSYPNVFKVQNKGKELCDLLVVFNNHIIVFSDKSIEFKNKNGINEDWKKWSKKAIVESSNQIFGAERWIKRFPDRISLDAKGEEKFPFLLPKNEDMIIHRIVLASFSGNELKELMVDNKAFIINPSIIGEEKQLNTPFTVGQINKEKGFVHIMNEISLEILMTELNTVSDFVAYLLEKERFILSGQLYKAHSEEDLLTAYLENIDDEEKHSFKFGNEDLKIEIKKDIWQNHKNSDGYFLKKIEDKASYFWDDIIEYFSKEMISNNLVRQSKDNPFEMEIGLREMASENRLQRRIFAKSFIEKIETNISKQFLYRYQFKENDNNTIYVFVIMNQPINLNYDEYQKLREYLLYEYSMAIKSKYKELKKIIAIGRESFEEENPTYSLFYKEFTSWTYLEQIEAEKLCKIGGYLKDENIQKSFKEEIEYPYIN